MWRSLARRAWLHSFAGASKLRLPPVDSVLPVHEVVIRSQHSVQSVCLFSESSHFRRRARFLSSNSAESYEDPHFEPLNSEDNRATEGFNLDVDEVPHSGFGVEDDSVFDNKPLDDLVAERGVFSDELDRSADEESVDMDDEGVGQENQNDLEKVESLLSLLQSRGGVDGPLERHLEEMNLVLSQDLLIKVLETPLVPGENLISFFRWGLKKPGFKLTPAILSSLINAVCLDGRKRESYALWDFVKELGVKKKGVLNSEVLNELIALFSRLGEGKAAFEVFNSFAELGCSSTGDTYFLTVEALCRRSLYDLGCSVCEKMLNEDKLPGIQKVGKIISYLCKGGRTSDAYLVYSYVKDKKMNPPGFSVTRLVYSLSCVKKAGKRIIQEMDKEQDKKNVSLALELLNDYSAEDRRYATKPFTAVVKKLCWIEDVQRATSLILEMIASRPPPGNDAFNCVINGLTKAGYMEEALNMMNVMKNRCLKPDVYTYNVVMSGFSKAGEMEKACEIYAEAKKNHSKLTPITYHILIRGFCKLEQFDKAVELLGEMKQHGVRPNQDEYNKLIKSLCLKAVDWETAEALQEEMKKDGLSLNGRTRALIAAVRELKSSQC